MWAPLLLRLRSEILRQGVAYVDKKSSSWLHNTQQLKYVPLSIDEPQHFSNALSVVVRHSVYLLRGVVRRCFAEKR
jgi:hypothetical protein